jgi:4-amino-4-deoxy-L-arabinose transferase-like glycosyltransferase
MSKRAIVLGLLLALSLAGRLRWLHDEPIVHEPDEFLHLTMAENFAAGATSPRYEYSTAYGDHFLFVPPLPLYTAGMVFRLFGASLVAFRAMNVVFGLAAVAAFWALSGLYLNGVPRLVSAAVFALSPLALYESTVAMLGAPAVFFLLVSLWAYVLYQREGRRGDLVVFAVSLGAAAACKQFGVLLGGVVLIHGIACRVAGKGRPLRAVLAGLGIAVGAFVLLAPWVVLRPYDSLHFYLYQTVVVQALHFLRGLRAGGALIGLPYPELLLAYGAVGLLGLVAFLATWRRPLDALAFYGVLLALPICLVREVRYLGLALPAVALFVGYALAVGEELAGRRWAAARIANRALAVLLVAPLLVTAAVSQRTPSGLDEACRYVAQHSAPADRILSNYWRPVIERLTRRRAARDWLDAEAKLLLQRRAVRFVILDESEYTRQVLGTAERKRLARWVREELPEAATFGPPEAPTRVYRIRRDEAPD